ncbi:MAG TPA: hypothetical protein VK722_02710 [Candidatus Aquilonibacter sp.]|jgi:hypothetical protein|nr:hypothetical protein [Candidatus Aquilonibacter sp.]
MTGKRCRRLLAVWLLFFLAIVFLRAQDAAAYRYNPSQNTLPPTTAFARTPYIPIPAPVSAPGPKILPRPVAPHRITLPLMTDAAGIIFSGQVISVGRAEGQSAAIVGPNVAPTTITFEVEDGIRGIATGQRLTIHEWAGLWTNAERYRVGERVFLFLHSPSRLGLTSPVFGSLGRFSMDPQRRIILSAQHVSALADDALLAGDLLTGKTIIPYANFAEAVRRVSILK